MSNFDDIESIYIHLEGHATDYRHLYQIGDLYKSLINKYREDKDPDSEKRAHNEREAFFFHIINSFLFFNSRKIPIDYLIR